MTSAFMFLNCEQKQIGAAKSELAKISHVTSVYETTGIYDIVVKVDANSEEMLHNIVRQIRAMAGVSCTTTTIIAVRRRNKKESLDP